MIVNVLEHQYVVVRRRPPFPLRHAVLMTLWTLANQESFRGVGDRFGISKGNCHSIFITVCQLLCNKVQLWIRWPAPGYERVRILQGFANLRRVVIIGTFAIIDGTHIGIPGPLNDESFYNRKGFHSVLAQIVCSFDYEIIDVFCGFPGSCHDARMWHESPLGLKLQEHAEEMLPEDSHILGDSAYPCTPTMLVPFKNDGHLTEQQKNFNTVLSSTRVVVEQTIGLLKCRLRRLRYLHIYNLSYAKFIITAACIIHNIRVKERSDGNENNIHDSDDDDDDGYDSGLDGISDNSDDDDDLLYDDFLAEEAARDIEADANAVPGAPYDRDATRAAGQARRLRIMQGLTMNRN